MQVISAVFHPLLMSTYCGILLYFTFPEIFSPIPLDYIPYFIGAIFVTTAVVPALSVLFLMATSKISNLEITRIEERITPFFSIALFYAASTYLFYTKMMLPPPLLIMMIGVTALIFIILLTSFRFKISVHSAAIWGMAGYFTGIGIRYTGSGMLIPLIFILLAAGLTTTSRLYLNRHTTNESWVGAILGYTFCLTLFLFFI